MFDILRRLVDDAYRAQDSGMSAGLPRVTVDASQLKHLLDHYDALDEACKALSKQERLGKEFEDAIMSDLENLYEP
jgi:hypothetical protein